ncbi:MAG: spore germination protein [Acutalibacteraceae bacterium]|nr:spore germination protein [Acutalibacteraceae bacterium]
MNLYTNYQKNYEILNIALHADKSFDLVSRKITIKGRKSCMFFIDGLVKDEIMEKIMEFFFSVNDENFMKNAKTFSENCVPYVEVDIVKEVPKIVANVLSGMTALIVDGFDSAIMIDSRTYPQRTTAEPEKDKVMRGSKDGFVETLISNLALIRRRIRDSDLTVRAYMVGEKSKTDVAVVYMDSLIDRKLLKKICEGIKNLKIDSLTMNQQSLLEALYKHKWYNPLPKIKYTERPDTTAAALLDGNIVIFVDNSPSALILPTSLFDIIEEADDYYFPPITGTYIRFTRYLVTIATLFITPVWLLTLQNPNFVPDNLKFILLTEPVNVPVFWQLIILEVAIDGLRLASIKTPNSLSASLSIIGAIALSEFAVKVGWFSTEAMLYMAFVAIANYTQPSYELGYALKFFRIFILTATVLFNFIGFIVSVLVVIILLITNKTISGKSYLYPLIPFDGKKLLRKIIRKRI